MGVCSSECGECKHKKPAARPVVFTTRVSKRALLGGCAGRERDGRNSSLDCESIHGVVSWRYRTANYVTTPWMPLAVLSITVETKAVRYCQRISGPRWAYCISIKCLGCDS